MKNGDRGGTGEAWWAALGVSWVAWEQPRVPLASSVSPPCPLQAHNAGLGGPNPTDMVGGGHSMLATHRAAPAEAACCSWLCVYENSMASEAGPEAPGQGGKPWILGDPFTHLT